MILPSTPCSPKWYLPFRYSDYNFVHISYLPRDYTAWPNPVIILDLIILTHFCKEYKKIRFEVIKLLEKISTRPTSDITIADQESDYPTPSISSILSFVNFQQLVFHKLITYNS
jgi:hypothetical protein